MKYDEFLKQVGTLGGPTEKAHADEASRLVLATLGQRLAGREPHNLASQLPVELQEPLLRHDGAAETVDDVDDVDDFLRRIADHEGRGCSTEDALAHARAVLGTIAGFVTAGEIADVRSQLPTGYATLFEQPA